VALLALALVLARGFSLAVGLALAGARGPRAGAARRGARESGAAARQGRLRAAHGCGRGDEHGQERRQEERRRRRRVRLDHPASTRRWRRAGVRLGAIRLFRRALQASCRVQTERQFIAGAARQYVTVEMMGKPCIRSHDCLRSVRAKPMIDLTLDSEDEAPAQARE
jgi:hypothetical protein